jgi:hypothetical protein
MRDSLIDLYIREAVKRGAKEKDARKEITTCWKRC